MSSADQSNRSASLTSIVGMYQRPMTASSTYPVLRSNGSAFYDYSEEFSKPDLEARSDTNVPLSPIPQRRQAGFRHAMLQHDSDLHMHGALSSSTVRGYTTSAAAYRGYNSTDVSMEESFDSYLQGSHDDSIEEIERVIANAISNAAADRMMVASERFQSYRNALRAKQGDKGQAHADPSTLGGDGRRLAIPEQQTAARSVAGPGGLNSASKRASQAGFNRNQMALDPAFADFTSLLSSFERLAKSPFSRLSDEDDADDLTSRRSSRLSAMETLDEIEAMEESDYRRHRSRAAAGRSSTPALSGGGSTAGQMPSSRGGMSILTPEPLSPNRQKKFQQEFRENFMKALPPLPVESLLESPHPPLVGRSIGAKSENTPAMSQIRSKSLRSHLSRSSSPGKLKLRAKTPSSSGDTESAGVPYEPRSERRSAEDYRFTPSSRPPPRLKLKVSRSQLGQGKNNQIGSVIRNNRLKQCNALADVAQPPRLDIAQTPRQAELLAGTRAITSRKKAADRNTDERCSMDGSRQPSDQFNLSYPPTLEAEASLLPRPSISDGLEDEPPVAPSEAADTVTRRVKPKFSFLRLRPANAATAATLVKPAPCSSRQDVEKPAEKVQIPSLDCRSEDALCEERSKSVSVHSDRVGNRVKRWASDAKRAVRFYVRRTLVRSAKAAPL